MRIPDWSIWLFPTSTLLGLFLAGVAVVMSSWVALGFGVVLVVAPLVLVFMES